MKKHTAYAFLISFVLLFLCSVPSLAANINKLYGQLMLMYSENARFAAADISGNDLGLELDADQEKIYKLGYARGYDDANTPSTQSTVSKAASVASSILNSNSSTSPSTSSSIMVWIPTNGGKKYHDTSTCSNMKNPKRVTLSEAKRLGFDSCGRCHPPE